MALTGWAKFRDKHPEGSAIECQWHDGWRKCKIRGYEGKYPVLETKNGGILVVDNMKAMRGVAAAQ